MKRPRVRDDLASMGSYHSPQVEVDVRLNTNEAYEAPPPEFSQRLAEATNDVVWHRYPDRAALELRTRIGQVEGFPPEQVFAANGSNEVLQSLLLAYGGPGRAALVFEPTYAMHGHIARVVGTDVIEVDRGDDFLIDIDAATAAIDEHRPAVIFLCSPNNPSGIEEPRPTIEAIVAAAGAIGSLVIVDEAYGQFARRPLLDLVAEDAPVAVTRTYSKTWSMAAARLGYLVGPTWLVDELEKVVLPYHLDVVKQTAGIIALDYLDEMDARASATLEERGRVQTALEELPVHVWPSGSNFILFRPDAGDGDAVWQALLDESVLVRNCSSWPRLEDCLRVTIGTPSENDRFVEALRRALRS